jgi:iron complex transport system substrate-binding protein
MRFTCELRSLSTTIGESCGERQRFRSRYTLHIVILLMVFGSISGCLSSPFASDTNEPASTNSTIVFTDSTNKSFSFPHPAERIVTVNADTVETLIVLGAGNKIIGVTDNVAKNPQFMNHLPNAKNIGESGNPNIELISSLHPDVVVVMNSAPEGLKTRLTGMNFTLVTFDCYILSDLQSSVRELGIMTGKSENSERYLLFFQRYDSLISTRIGNLSADQQATVYFEIGSDYTAAGKGSGGSSLIRHIKATNIAENPPTPWPKVSLEWIVNNNPEVIIKTVHTYAGDKKEFPELYDGIRTREGFSGIRAIKNERVYVMSSNILYGPRGIIGQLYLGKIMYPVQFSDIDPDEVLHQYAKDCMSEADVTATVYPPFTSNR